MNIKDILRGCKPGKAQQVGFMTVIPLVSSLVDERFLSAKYAEMQVQNNYGKMLFSNRTDSPIIVPLHTAVITKQKAQRKI